METSRRQLHSCDPCRKGKRRCDAPKNRKDTGFSGCYNCKRWKKECTFNWLSSKRIDAAGGRRKAPVYIAEKSIPSVVSSDDDALSDEQSRSLPSYPATSDDMFASGDFANFALSFTSDPQDREGTESGAEQSEYYPWSLEIPVDWQNSGTTQRSQRELESLINSSENSFDVIQRPEGEYSPSSFNFVAPGYEQISLKASSTPSSNQRPIPRFPSSFCIASENTADQYARSTMTRNLIRIYHDSMENALSCWLTEHNCPYSDLASTVLPNGERQEWGPNWSNRMCIRVCRLDRASSSIRGRALSAEEDKTAARVLNLAIIAFASQWTQHAQKGATLSVPETISRDERSIREYVWNEARHGLEHSTTIPSFRIIFANIIFSLTQSPLDSRQDKGLGQLLENDSAPTFLETANRQLFTFRHKFVKYVREAPPRVKELRGGSIGLAVTDESEILNPSGPLQVDPILASHEHRNTLNLLFWLGVMFDTLSAAMYQRPLVVSDEDSQVSSAPPAILDPQDQLQLGFGRIAENRNHKKQDMWGEFFLHRAERHKLSGEQPRWPCSYDEAASVLSEATPVKVLLYRRVTQLQTLVYRGASCDVLEGVIQKTLLVYRHWNCTYRRFMLDCVENHDLLPPRIQSWYVILDGHWHLATMLLADAIEGIDNGRLGFESERETRKATSLVSTLRTEHAFMVGALARASLHGQNPSMHRHFHDSLNEVAFLVEPWTVVLIHSFAKAAYISLETLDNLNDIILTDSFRQNCESCICALQYLGRKSDMASMVARNLSILLDLKLAQIL